MYYKVGQLIRIRDQAMRFYLFGESDDKYMIISLSETGEVIQIFGQNKVRNETGYTILHYSEIEACEF